MMTSIACVIYLFPMIHAEERQELVEGIVHVRMTSAEQSKKMMTNGAAAYGNQKALAAENQGHVVATAQKLNPVRL